MTIEIAPHITVDPQIRYEDELRGALVIVEIGQIRIRR